MKVLIISHLYPSSFNETSGIFVHQQAKTLQKQGCEVKVISPVPWSPFPIKYLSRKWKKYSEIPQHLIYEEVEVYYPRYLTFPKGVFSASSGQRMYQGIKSLVSSIYTNFRFDLIHSHVALPDGYAGMMLANKYKKPLIITIHGQDFQQTIYKNEESKTRIRQAINYSTKTILVSNKLKTISEQQLQIASDKIVVIPNGIDLDTIYKSKPIVQLENKDSKIILSVSNLTKIKGIDYTLRALARLKDKYPKLIYLIIGDGVERKNLERLVQDLRLQDRVDFLGQLSHKQVMEYMSLCDIFSLPSWNEAFGVVYLEAMAHGKPVIACQGEGIDGIIKNKEDGILVTPKDINSLVEAIDFLFSNPEKAKEIGMGAKKLVFENYSWEQAVQRIINVYKDAVKLRVKNRAR